MIEISKTCPLCHENLKKGKDSIHFNCKKCDILWHIEDLDGKIEKIMKIITTPNYIKQGISLIDFYRIKDKNSKTYLQAEKNAFTLLYSSDWYIWGIKNSINREINKRSDILIINKYNRTEFKILNWKRSYRVKGKGYHSWHYELYLGDELLTDGEYLTDKYEKSKQSNLIHYIMDIIRNEFYELYTEIGDCGHRSDEIRINNNKRLCRACYFKILDEEFRHLRCC